jgi:hypothetical protein
VNLRRACLAGCSLLAAAACAAQPPLSSSDAGFVHWIGLDSRPLAVGSQILVTLEISTDAGSQPPIDVTSSNVDVVSIANLDGGAIVYPLLSGQFLLDVVGSGSATLEVQTTSAKADLDVTAAIGVAMEIWDAEHYAVGSGQALNPKFPLDLLANTEELLQGVVLDANGEALNSWGLIEGPISVSPQPPEQFILSPGTSPSATLTFGLFDAGGVSFDAGLNEDAGVPFDAASSVSLTVNVVSSAALVKIVPGYSDGLVVIAEAIASDKKTEVFGIDDWEFSCAPAETCVVTPLSPSVASLTIPSNSGSHKVTASSSSQALTGNITVP